MEKESFIVQLRQMIEIKEKIADLLTYYDFAVGNTLIESLMNGIGLDAKKHISILKGLLDRAQGLNQAIPEETKENVLKTLDTVIELEWNIINQNKAIIDKITDQKTKAILNNILGEVQRHEAILKGLKNLISELTVEEEKVLDKIWKYGVKFDDDE
ncbi:MAG: hypothetical protein K9W46_03875 [Candidatus Heimdallarchaeum endolithica]|uniref:Rubrerythrin diiron-binding domain-containing protein n=1 Tax=Candidatus Heimdallarchaeum endolithica TaxID=2876572 RepID=A0A9Y1FQ11_9ARCH|nr:MAG: hypothetical protein K9W46_03875 [Candidatus Heimdallarchaeum endolithica]